MDITSGVTSFLTLFNAFWTNLIGITFIINGISFRIIDISIGILIGCVGIWVIRKIFYD